MKLALETKALGWAVLAASISLGGALLTARPIQALSNSNPAPMAPSSPSPPIEMASSSDPVGQGRKFFEMSCSECHGDDATGDEGPNLHNLAISNARIAATIRNGVKGEMPAFAKKYGDPQIAALVAFLRTLR
jgi:mono/diheme cytochrome c family protein